MNHKIKGQEIQYIEVSLNPGTSIVSESGSLMSMDDGIQMEPIFGSGSESKGIIGNILGASKRVLTGESFFLMKYKNTSREPKVVTISPYFPGKIIGVDLRSYKEGIISQKGSFFCSDAGVVLDIEITKNLKVGLFSGAGFVLQKITGSGSVFLNVCGAVQERTLSPGEVIRIETGLLVAMEATVSLDVEVVDFKTQMFGNTGLFISKLTGPGKVWIQSNSSSKVLDRLVESTIKKLPRPKT